MFKHSIILILISLSANIITFAQRRIPPQKPKLIVQITIENFRYDFMTRYWDKFGDKGFKEFSLYGAVCKNAQINYMYTQSAPGFASIATGATPSGHGIIADRWFDRTTETETDCVADTREQTIGSREGQCSPRRLVATTIADELKIVDFNSKVFSIAIDNSAAVLSAGHIADGVFWFDENSGDFVTSSFYNNSLPAWAKQFNQKKQADIYLNKKWETSLQIEKYQESLADQNQYEIGFRSRINFPYELLIYSSRPNRYEILKSTPFANSLIKDMAINAIANENLGRDNHTDLLNLTFSATEYIGKKFGSMSVEMEDAYIKLDKEIEFLISYLEEEIGRENILFILTSNHGSAHSPKYLTDIKIPAGQFKYAQAVSLLKSYLNAIYGEGEWVKYYKKQQIYLNHRLIESSKLSIAEVQQKAAELIIQMSGVANVITSTTLQTTSFSDPILKRMQNSYSQKLSGDLLINLQAGWVEQSVDEVSIHNSAYSYDTHIPLIWYGWKVERQTISDDIDITDIAATLSSILNISQPTMCTGKIIKQINK